MRVVRGKNRGKLREDGGDAVSASGISGIVSQQSVDSAIVQAAKSLAMAAESMQGAMDKQQKKPGEKLDRSYIRRNHKFHTKCRHPGEGKGADWS